MVAAYEHEFRSDAVIVEETEPSVSGVSWPAVAAGAIANLAATSAILTLGVGLGLSVVSPWGFTSPTAFKIGTGLFFIVMAMIGASIGGYVAGRLRTRWTGVRSDEVYFRDTAHGFLSWAFASVLGLLLLAGPAALVAGGGLSGASPAQSGNPADKYVRALIQSDAAAPDVQALARWRDELRGPVATALANGGAMSSSDSSYVQRVVAAGAGLSPAESGKRAAEVSALMKSDIDKARGTAAQMALWLAAAMAIGAFCASLAATEGGGLRDGTWGRRLT